MMIIFELGKVKLILNLVSYQLFGHKTCTRCTLHLYMLVLDLLDLDMLVLDLLHLDMLICWFRSE